MCLFVACSQKLWFSRAERKCSVVVKSARLSEQMASGQRL